MGLSVCPSAIVAAPTETVWSLLDPLSQLDKWADGKVISVVPEGSATPGQRAIIRSRAAGRIWNVTFVVEDIDREQHVLQMNVTFPFGMHLHERIMCSPIDAQSCRVQYGWDLSFPRGLRGWFLETFGSKAFEASIVDSLQRLKRASEKLYNEAQ